VEGEISNLARPASGHLYFSLKDAASQVRCAMFRGKNMRLAFTPKNGMQVLTRARVGLYEGRGEFQLIVDYMEESGEGALRRAFEQLKQKLATEGLFAEEHKQPVPPVARCIGVITSPSGAAIRDILNVHRRRFPAIPLIIYPTAVQGDGAAQQIADAIVKANQRKECDVLIVSRGGGSLEDLWAFNEEVVARAIYNSALPVVTGVGHEIDFTIADFVADQRAPTPSAAIELLTPDQSEWRQQLNQIHNRLHAQINRVLKQQRQSVQWLEKRLQQQHPQQRLLQHSQRIDELEQRLSRSYRAMLRTREITLATLASRLQRRSPEQQLLRLQARHAQLKSRLASALARQLETRRQRLAMAGRTLDTVSPLATLGRGYALVTRPDGTLVRDASTVKAGEQVTARVQHGRLYCTVNKTESEL
jgi:exodeoxyribonuclease VII large subunit